MRCQRLIQTDGSVPITASAPIQLTVAACIRLAAAAPTSRDELRARRQKEEQNWSEEERAWARAHGEALKKDEGFLTGVRKCWALALGRDGEEGAELVFAQYLKLHVRLTKLLSPSFASSGAPSLSELAQRDWAADLERVGVADTSKETGRMGWAGFVESLFELCDLWTVVPVSADDAPAAYAAFLGSCFERITAPAPLQERAADDAGASSESPVEAASTRSLGAPAPGTATHWRDVDDVLSCVGTGASPLAGVALLPPPEPQKVARKAKPSEPAPRAAAAAVAASTPEVAAPREDKQDRDSTSPPGAWAQLDVSGESPGPAKPTPPKGRSAERQAGRRSGRILGDKQLTQEARRTIQEARKLKQQTVDVASADGGTTTFDLRRMRATKYPDSVSKAAAERGEHVETEQHDVELQSVEVPAWVTKPEAWRQQMQVRADLAKEWLDEKEARFRQFTDRFVDLRVRYINQLDAEITGRALAKRTFDTSWMGELRKPSSLDPTGWVALRPVSGAAATVFFLRQVLGLAAAWEAEPLSLLSTVEQGALLLHAVCRTTRSGRMLATELANRVQGPEYPELQCPVGTEQIAGLVLEVTRRIPGVEVAMAQGVDEAIRRFPAVLDVLGNEQVSRMDGCNLVDTLVKEVFSQVCELTGYGEGTVDSTGATGKPLVLDPTSGDSGFKVVSSLTLSLPPAGDAARRVAASLRPRPAIPKSRSAREHVASGITVPAHLCAPRYRSKLTTLGGVSPRWYPDDGEQASQPTDEFLSPLSPMRAQRMPRPLGNATDVHPNSRIAHPPTYAISSPSPSISSYHLEREQTKLQHMIEQRDLTGKMPSSQVGGVAGVAAEESKPFSEVSNPGQDSITNMTWAAATAEKGKRRALEEARALAERGPSAWTTPRAQPPHSRAWVSEFKAKEDGPCDAGVLPTGQKWHVQTRKGGKHIVVSAGVGFI